jgi:nucleotide sugar dehydrogenase
VSTVAIIGQGYVGLPLAQGACAAGFQVIGIDIEPRIVACLNAGVSHVDDLSDDEVTAMISSGYRATTDFDDIEHAEIVVVCVPTPLTGSGEPNLEPLIAALTEVSGRLRPRTMVVIESTTYPGTTDEVARPILEADRMIAGKDFSLAFSPERIDPGNAAFGLKNTPKIVGGHTPECADRAAAFYGKFVDHVVRTKGTREAEMAKLLENTYRHINIALMNEMARFCNDLKIDLWDVIDAASTKPFGFQAFRPGPGVGGHCIPIDPNYLSHSIRHRLGYPFRFVELAQEINDSMPEYVASRVERLLEVDGIQLRDAEVLLLGITYKPDVGDTRETPATPLTRILAEKGARVRYHDPFMPNWAVDGRKLDCVPDLATALQETHICVLLQNHKSYDLDWLGAKASRLLDTRGVMAPSPTVERL